MNKATNIFKKALHQIRFRMELKRMDDMWNFMGGYCLENSHLPFTIRIQKKK